MIKLIIKIRVWWKVAAKTVVKRAHENQAINIKIINNL